MSKKRTPLIIYMEKAYILPFRIIMFVVALPFLSDLHQAWSTGVANTSNYPAVRGENWGFYVYLFKQSAFSFFFIWLGTFGVKDKSQAEK